jgi:tol-pal system-associated acyl-CoA thioesterase
MSAVEAPFVVPLQIYYEDTDLSGSVYHANYLRYFERAREHLLGPEALVRLWKDEGIGFVVYKCELSFREPATLGDCLEIRTLVRLESEFRAVFQQSIWRPGGKQAMTEGVVQLVCVDRTNKVVPLPLSVRQQIRGE